MKLGADPKRIAILGTLVLVAVYVLYTNVFSGGSSSNASAPLPRTVAVAPVPAAEATAEPSVARRRDRNRGGEWKPVYLNGKGTDPIRVDPTLRLDLLAKVQSVQVAGVQRNLFQFGEVAKVDPGPLPKVQKIVGLGGPAGALGSGGPPKPLLPAVPQPPPILLKYYGYSSGKMDGHKHAFFLDGDDIIVASEGEMLKRRYKLVKIGVNSVTMEDTEFKSQQTLPLAEDAAA